MNWLILKLFWLEILLAKFMMRVFGYVPSALRNEFARNPLLKYPRNEHCWCGSHRKAKWCCLPNQAKVCRKEHEAMLEKYMVHVQLATKEPSPIHTL